MQKVKKRKCLWRGELSFASQGKGCLYWCNQLQCYWLCCSNSTDPVKSCSTLTEFVKKKRSSKIQSKLHDCQCHIIWRWSVFCTITNNWFHYRSAVVCRINVLLSILVWTVWEELGLFCASETLFCKWWAKIITTPLRTWEVCKCNCSCN